MIRILLPHSNYTAQVWDHEAQKWTDLVFDIVEMKHFDKNFDPFGKQDFALFIKAEVESHDLIYVKVKYDKKPHSLAQNLVQTDSKATSLEISGFSENGEVLFKYQNPAQDIDQTFGVSLKYYHGHVRKDRDLNRMLHLKKTEEERADLKEGDGPYIFKPEWRDPLPQQYSKLVEDVVY